MVAIKKNADSTQSLVDAATELLRNRILDLSLKPGASLDDRLLMEKFSLSRTPAREAMNRLSTEGLIVFRSNRGAYVAPLDLGDISDLMDAYIINERVVGFLLQPDDPGLVTDLRAIQKQYAGVQKRRELLEVTRLNAHFHSRMASATRNRFVYEYSVRLYNLARRVSFFIYLKERNRVPTFKAHAALINRHHNDLIGAIELGQNSAVMQILTEHARLFRDRVRRVFVDSESESFEPSWQ